MTDHLLTQPIPKLIRQIAIPASIGFFFQTMFNVVDTFYAGLISTEAIAALSISFPVFFLIIAIGAGVSQGSTALIANALGEKRKTKAMNLTSQSLSFAFLLSILLTFLGILLAPWLFRILGADGSYLQSSLDYISIIYLGTVFFLLNNVLNGSLIAIGDTKSFRNFLVIGFFLNLILDPWFLYGGWGVPAMGIKGIALATVLIQAVGVGYMLSRVLKSGMLNRESIHHVRPRKKAFLDIAKQGFPASVNMLTVALGIFVITYFISWFSQEAVAAYGIATRIEQIALLPTIGINMATLSLVGQNNGARKFGRVKQTLHTAIRYGLFILSVGGILVFVFARQLMGLFTKDPAVIAIGAQYLPIAAFIFWSYTILFITTAALQGMKRPMFALYMGLFRQVLAPLLVYWALARWFGLLGLWWGIFFVNWMGAIIALLYVRSVMRHFRDEGPHASQMNKKAR